MIRFTLVTVAVVFLAAPLAADEAKGTKVEFTIHDGYFEKHTNNTGLPGDLSFLAITSAETFNKVFGVAFVMGKKPNLVPKDAFEKKIVVATIKRGNAVTTYTVEKVTIDGETLYVQYQTTTVPAGNARFASPLIISVDKGKVKKVVFIENSKIVGTTEIQS